MSARRDIERLHRAGALGWGGPGWRAPARRRPSALAQAGAPPWRPPSVREFGATAPPRAAIAELLDAAYGEAADRRNVPSAGAIYGLDPRCVPPGGGLAYRLTRGGRLTEAGAVAVAGDDLARATFHALSGPHWLVAVCGDPDPYAERYGARGYRYLLLEAGHLCQELLRGAAAGGLASVVVGAFDDDALSALLGLELVSLLPLVLVAIGAPR